MKVINYPNAKISFDEFSGGERNVYLNKFPNELLETMNVRVDLRSSSEIMDLLLFSNALNNYYGTEVFFNLEIPYLPYARQDRVCHKGEAFSLEVMAKLLKQLPIRKLVIWDCHSDIGLRLTRATNVEATEIIMRSKPLTVQLQEDKCVLICPDSGAIKRVNAIAQKFNVKEVVLCEKQRDISTGGIIKTIVHSDNLSGKIAIIVDDICDGGGTFINIAKILKEKNVSKVILYVTHGIFRNGLEVFNGLIDEFYTTNSFPQKDKKIKQINYLYNWR